ncbi:MAG: tyrosine--tRNA ligase [Parcubacteria group bacterium]|nr:tyrosine--tRNA ligase [Parcubacteria group bacterium]
MQQNVFTLLKERGFVKQSTDEEGIRELLSGSPITFYAGFDPTADSFHVGNLALIMAMSHLQRAGHRAIALLGGGTALIGDPSGRTEARPMMAQETIDANSARLRLQLAQFLTLDEEERGMLLDNALWLCEARYIDFLREVGAHFRVNEMVKTETYRERMERGEGLSFLEFNYQLLQAYDYLQLFHKYRCVLQIGGSDQWGNMIAGVDLVRRKERKLVYVFTIPLVTAAGGKKMGKTAAGAVWLDAEKTSPYEFYQYWINVDDGDVERFLLLFTFLPAEEIRKLASAQGAALRDAKARLAFEVTTLVHGEAEAKRAREGAHAAFGGGEDGDASAVPTITISRTRLAQGIPIVDLLVETGLSASKGAARRLIAQGGVSIGGATISSPDAIMREKQLLDNNAFLLRAGKRRYHRVVVENGAHSR